MIRYLRGQLFLCAIMGVIGLGHRLLRHRRVLPILIGLWVGLTEIIPVLGAFLGAIPAVLIALVVPGGGLHARPS